MLAGILGFIIVIAYTIGFFCLGAWDIKMAILSYKKQKYFLCGICVMTALVTAVMLAMHFIGD